MMWGIQKLKRKIILVVIALYLCTNLFTVYAISEDESNMNRYNVVIVLDASNSVNYTDPDGFRYEAVSQFANLLTEEGNYLGGIVFSNHVEAWQPPGTVESQDDKNDIIELLASVKSQGTTDEMGYTNIGEALLKAVELLASDGSEDLPSVIVFLSDGNTEMPTEDELAVSLDEKATAIQVARENDISIYTVCLNANDDADTDEMEQISKATGGVFQEVGSAEDLKEVFNIFYSLIYGTSTVPLVEDIFPENGVMEVKFEVPGFGVEEVNVVINGSVSDTALAGPDAVAKDVAEFVSDTYTLLKITDAKPGNWTLEIEGNPGDEVEVNMIYNSNLSVDMKVDSAGTEFTAGQTLSVKAVLKAGTISATEDSQYIGYRAKLCVMDAYGNELESVPMTVANGQFEAKHQFDEGVYYLKAVVEGNNLERSSNNVGPLQIISSMETDALKVENTPPEAAINPVKRKVYIWPFKESSLSIDMAGLAIDAQDEELDYKVVSSSFIEGIDYQIDGTVISMDHFSLSKGSFDIKVTDSGGLSCNIELNVVTRNVGIMALVGLGVIVFIALIILCIIMRIIFTRPFNGEITIKSYVNGRPKERKKNPRRGNCRLSSFGLDPLGKGIIYSKSCIWAPKKGEKFITLKTNVPVYCDGKMTNEIKVVSGSIGRKIYPEMGSKNFLHIIFQSRVKNGRQRRGYKDRSNVRKSYKQATK